MAALSGGGDTSTGNDQILDFGAALLNYIIYEQVRRHGACDAEVSRHLVRVELPHPRYKGLEECLQKIVEELEGNVQLQRMLNDSALQPTKDVFIKVADAIFSDGKFNWGRVVALFYFAGRLVTKSSSTDISVIKSWTMSYIQEHVINWIREQGGWVGIHSYFRPPTWQTVGLCLAGVITTVLVIYKMLRT